MTTIQDTIIQALEASYDAHRMALARIDMLASERPGLVSRMAELETEVGALRSQIARRDAEEVAHLGSIQSLIAELAQAVEKTKSVLGEARSAPTPAQGPPTEGSPPILAATEPAAADTHVSPMAPVAEPAGSSDGPATSEATSPTLEGDDNSISSDISVANEIHLRGGLDVVTKDFMWGWVQDINNPMEQITVLIRNNGREIARTIANSYRQDLHKDGIGDGCYGYTITFQNDLWSQEPHVPELFYLIGRVEIKAADQKLTALQAELDSLAEVTSGR